MSTFTDHLYSARDFGQRDASANMDILELTIISQGRPRILILSASVGSGHVRAASAVRESLQLLLPHATLEHVDVLDLTNAAFRKAYADGYFRAAERTPSLVGMMYDYLDRPTDDRISARARLAFERMNFTRLKKLLTDQPWDLVINTHFLPAQFVSRLRNKGAIDFPQVTVVTDFDIHGMWIAGICEKYFVANEESRANAMAAGVPADRVVVTGIPIDPRFADQRDRLQTMWKLGLSPELPVVLQMGGGFGVGSVERIHQLICDVEHPMQIIAIAGKNEEARKALEATVVPNRHSRRVLGFTNQMHDLLCAADIVVTKPGGLTTSECLASGCAMVVTEPIPGQEDRNADFVLENGCAVKVNNLASLTHKLNSLLTNSGRLTRMRESASHCAKSRAAMDVAKLCAEMVCVDAEKSAWM